jgi:hypothetical protein
MYFVGGSQLKNLGLIAGNDWTDEYDPTALIANVNNCQQFAKLIGKAQVLVALFLTIAFQGRGECNKLEQT